MFSRKALSRDIVIDVMGVYRTPLLLGIFANIRGH
jgi:hypothetical protein